MKQSFDIAAELDMPTLPAALARVEQQLAACTTVAASPQLQEPLARVLGSKGKRLRPTLVVAIAAHYSGQVSDAAVHAAAALELAHIASLVHDDIIDNASNRRGVPTINSVEGVNQAILAGDVLFAQACAKGTQAGAAVGSVVAEAIIALCDGESQEVASEHDLERSQVALAQTMTGKTVALFMASCRAGGLCANASSDQVAALAMYGHELGMAFQLVDDLLDLLSTNEISGKPVGNDIREGVYTLPIILGLRGAHREQIKTWLQNPEAIPYDTLVALLMQEGYIAHTLQLAQQHNASAAAAMQQAGGSNGLAALPEAYTRWALRHMVAPNHRDALSAIMDTNKEH
jgi:geranylgeranyl pyrophosphate synthase